MEKVGIFAHFFIKETKFRHIKRYAFFIPQNFAKVLRVLSKSWRQ